MSLQRGTVTSAEIQTEIDGLRAQLQRLAERRGALAFAVRTDPGKQAELNQVRAEIAKTQDAIDELELAQKAAQAHEKDALKTRRAQLIETMAEKLRKLEENRDALVNKARRDQDPDAAAQAMRLGRMAYGLACDLVDLTHNRLRFGQGYTIRQQLREMAPPLDVGRVPLSELPCQAELAEIRAIDSQLHKVNGR